MAEEREGGPSEKVLKLFGVSILRGEGGGREEATTVAVAVEEDEAEVMRKSSSMGNLASCTAEPSAADHGAGDQGYHSDGGLLQSGSGRRRRCQERKRGVPWTEEEHRTFLAGLEKLGKGDWRGISRKFVMTRTPTQVASHAQKYFLRQNNPGKKKRRSSLFDVVIKDKITPTEAAPMLSSTTNNGVKEDISHVNQDNKSVNCPAFVTTFVQSLGGGASSNFQHVANHSDITILPSPSAMVANSENRVNDQAITNYWIEPPLNIPGQMDMLPQTKISCAPDFLGLTLSYSSCQTQSSVTTPTTETSDLELRIAPPQPHNLSKLSSSGTADAIRVI